MSALIDQKQEVEKVPRAVLVAQLKERDGENCQHPDCGKRMDFSLMEGPMQVTLDHHFPQVYGRENGWTREQIWDLSNLKLMHRRCNAKKGDLIPNEDGTLPDKPSKTFRYRRDKRAERPESCKSCMARRNLGPDEWCNACGSGPDPGRFPKWRQMSVKECDHDLFYCVSCTIWFPENRRSALDALLTGGEGYE